MPKKLYKSLRCWRGEEGGAKCGQNWMREQLVKMVSLNQGLVSMSVGGGKKSTPSLDFEDHE